MIPSSPPYAPEEDRLDSRLRVDAGGPISECAPMPSPADPGTESLMRRFVLLAVLLSIGGCTTRVIPPGEAASVAPMLSVERFLQAANARDLDSMARLFGTSDGPVFETGSTLGCAFKKLGSWFGLGERCLTLQEVEIHMDLIAQIIQHEDYTIVSESAVAGRVNPTSRIGVDMRIDGRDIQDVPFTVVRTSEGRWLIEEVGLTRITGGGGRR